MRADLILDQGRGGGAVEVGVGSGKFGTGGVGSGRLVDAGMVGRVGGAGREGGTMGKLGNGDAGSGTGADRSGGNALGSGRTVAGDTGGVPFRVGSTEGP